jgi:hypothetical protein
LRKKLAGVLVDRDASLIGSIVQRGQTREEFDLPEAPKQQFTKIENKRTADPNTRKSTIVKCSRGKDKGSLTANSYSASTVINADNTSIATSDCIFQRLK